MPEKVFPPGFEPNTEPEQRQDPETVQEKPYPIRDLETDLTNREINELFAAHKRFVERVARNFFFQLRRDGSIGLEDCVQIGYIGLLKAKKEFDETKGTFKAFARVVINRLLAETSRNSQEVYIPIQTKKNTGEYHRSEEDTHTVPGRAISGALHWQQRRRTVRVGEDEEVDILNTLSVSTEPNDALLGNPEEISLQKIDVAKILDRARLTPKQRYLIVHRFGLEDNPPLTLEEIAKNRNVTYQGIEEMEKKALNKLYQVARRIRQKEND